MTWRRGRGGRGTRPGTRRLGTAHDSGILGADWDCYTEIFPREVRPSMERSDAAVRPVLVLDFGSQYVQLIARRVRERHSFGARHCPPRRDGRAHPGAEPARPDPFRGTVQRLRAQCASLRSGPVRPGHSRPGHLLRDAARRCAVPSGGAYNLRRPANTDGPSARYSIRRNPCSSTCRVRRPSG